MHLGAGVIVDQIRNSAGNYSLNSGSLIELKRQGVPDEVISAMQGKQKQAERRRRALVVKRRASGSWSRARRPPYGL
jgi:hypothetical protein